MNQLFMRLLFLFLIIFSHTLLADELATDIPATQDTPPPYLTDASITGDYYFKSDRYVRDVNVSTPIKGKFYFRIFVAHIATPGHLSTQLYNEIDGVAAFEGDIAHYLNPERDCLVSFFFTESRLKVEQRGNCKMEPNFGFDTTGIYHKTERFEIQPLLKMDD